MNDPDFRKNFFGIKLLQFNNEELLSITEFQAKEKDGYFIVYNKLNDIKDLLGKLDLKYTISNFSENNFNLKYFSFFTLMMNKKKSNLLVALFSLNEQISSNQIDRGSLLWSMRPQNQ
jgi:hypothetical protein